MIEEGLKYLLEIPQLVEIINKGGFSSKTYIKKMTKTARRNDIIVDAINNIPIREDSRKKIDQNSKYTILRNGAYYVNHYWDKNQKLRGKVAVSCPQYGH